MHSSKSIHLPYLTVLGFLARVGRTPVSVAAPFALVGCVPRTTASPASWVRRLLRSFPFRGASVADVAGAVEAKLLLPCVRANSLQPAMPESSLEKCNRLRLEQSIENINVAARRNITPRTETLLQLHKDAYKIALNAMAPRPTSLAGCADPWASLLFSHFISTWS